MVVNLISSIVHGEPDLALCCAGSTVCLACSGHWAAHWVTDSGLGCMTVGAVIKQRYEIGGGLSVHRSLVWTVCLARGSAISSTLKKVFFLFDSKAYMLISLPCSALSARSFSHSWIAEKTLSFPCKEMCRKYYSTGQISFSFRKEYMKLCLKVYISFCTTCNTISRVNL